MSQGAQYCIEARYDLQVTASKQTGPQSYSLEELNSANT